MSEFIDKFKKANGENCKTVARYDVEKQSDIDVKGCVINMTRNLYEIEYILTLLDDRFMETSTRVVAMDKETAIDKLQIWRKKQEPKYKDIVFLDVKKEWCEVVV